jgi:DNA-binding LytR/AlgR family response regulator
LLLILACALAFGWSLLAYVLKGLPLTRRWLHWTLSVAGVLLVIAWVPGFDSKSVLAILLSVLQALAYLLWARFSRGRPLGWMALLLGLFVVMVFLNAYSFIDTVYYYYVAGLIFMLMAQQAKQASQDQQLQLKYQARARQLQQIIEQKTLQDSTEKIEIRSAGKTEWVWIKDLAYCKAAGDYVELVDQQGTIKMFHGSLTELSLRLPTTFLKTHRSYLVNTTLISALERSPSGAGQLRLSQGAQVPVSKRIMPQVREQLS